MFRKQHRVKFSTAIHKTKKTFSCSLPLRVVASSIDDFLRRFGPNTFTTFKQLDHKWNGENPIYIYANFSFSVWANNLGENLPGIPDLFRQSSAGFGWISGATKFQAIFRYPVKHKERKR